MKETGYNKTMSINYVTGCFMAFRTEVVKQLNGFDDNFLCTLKTQKVHVVRTKYIAAFYPEACVIHAWERGSHKNIKQIIITIQSMITYFRKWGWKFK